MSKKRKKSSKGKKKVVIKPRKSELEALLDSYMANAGKQKKAEFESLQEVTFGSVKSFFDDHFKICSALGPAFSSQVYNLSFDKLSDGQRDKIKLLILRRVSENGGDFSYYTEVSPTDSFITKVKLEELLSDENLTDFELRYALRNLVNG